MKKIYFSLLLTLSGFLGLAQLSLPLDFESTTTTYNFTNFDGGAVTVVDNPQKVGINTSNKVGRMVKGPGGQPWGGSWIQLSGPINFSTLKFLRMKVFSSAPGRKVLLKVENESNPAQAFEKEAVTTVSGGWEDLSLDFSAIVTANSYHKVVLIFELGTTGDGSANFTFLFDDIRQEAAPAGTKTPPKLPITFESNTVDNSFINFDGCATAVIANPHKTGINTSDSVARMVKNAGAVWAGSKIQLGEVLNFNTNKIVRMKVYAPRVGAKILFKVEGALPTFEKEVLTTKANEWEDLSFDYSGVNTTLAYNQLVFILDLGTMGDGSANFTILFDDIRLEAASGGNLTQMTLPVTFDDPAVNYGLIGFGGAEGSSIVQDPTNPTNKVARVIKGGNAETWAGTTIGTPTGFASKIPFTASNSKMSVRIMSPAAGLTIRLKAEDVADGTKAVETDAVTTKANEWETLVFDFSKQVNGTPALNLNTNYAKLSIFFDFGTGGNGKVFRWDDVEMFAGQSLVLPLNFESSAITYNITNFDGGDVTVIDNPNKSGINTSNRVGRMIKNNGQPWGGSFITLDAPINFTGASTMKIKVHSPRAGAKLLLKVENLTDGGINFERELSISKANEWEELTFDYSAIDRSKSYQKVVLIFDLGTRGDGSANYTFYFDDIIVQ